MKAIVHDKYGSPGDVLELQDIDKPLAKDNAVLVRVHGTSVNPADWHFIRGEPYIARLQAGLRKPKDTVPGCDLAGHVEAVGRNATRFQPGDEVFGSPFMRGFGAFADYACISDDLDRRYSLIETPEAIRYLEEGHARGKVVVTV